MRSEIISQARRWIETPTRQAMRELGVGVDALGLVLAVGEAAAGLVVPPMAWLEYEGYPRIANSAAMGGFLDQVLQRIEPDMAGPGDIAWLSIETPGNPTHLAILAEHSGCLTLIHPIEGQGRVMKTGRPMARVVEHGFVGPWPGRVDAWYRYPGVV